MKPTEERVQQLPRLVRLLMLLTAAMVLILVVVVAQRYGPSAAPAPLVLEDEAIEGPPPAGSYHRPATLPRIRPRFRARPPAVKSATGAN